MTEQPDPAHLAPAPMIDSDHPAVVAFARGACRGADERERAVALYYAVRDGFRYDPCLLYTSPSPRDRTRSRMPSSA